ncbi:xylose isomerase [Clostridia bacterium]|nr:xylose isomerase [Clostridia bacterium]
MQDFRFGAQLFSIRNLCQNREDLETAMKAVSKIGYKGVQVSGFGRDIEPATIRQIMDDNGLEIVCTHVPLSELEEDTDASIEKHRVFGCKYPGLGSMPKEHYGGGETSLRAFIKRLNAIGDKLAAAGLTFLYHNHSHEFQRINGVLPMDLLVNECNKNVQFELDTYWVQMGGGNPVTWIEKHAAEVIHFKEMVGTAENGNVITSVGLGNLDWPSIIEACRKTRVKWAMIEQDNAVELDDPIDSFRTAYDYLTGLGLKT